MMSDDEQSLASRWLMFEASALVGASILERAPFKRAFYFLSERIPLALAVGVVNALGIGAVCREGSA